MHALILLCLVAAAGCASDPKAANDENFAKVISKQYDDPKNTVVCDTEDYTTKVDLPGQDRDATSFQNDARESDALVSAGLLKRSGPTTYTTPADFSYFKPRVEKIYSYNQLSSVEATSKGVSYAEGYSKSNARITLCAGHTKFEKVTNFTTPADALGAHVTTVTYEIEFSDQQPWAKNARLLQAYPRLKEAIENVDKPQNAMLMLTEKGWQGS